jgi:molybdate transport system substrate-binding protein
VIRPPGAVALVVAAMAAVVLGGVGCGGTRSDAAPPARTVTVFAAASLKTTFTALGQQLERDRPGVEVRFTFAGSSDLASQIREGAPADVFAAADTTTMAKVVADRLVRGEPARFATNRLQIAVPPDNPARISRFADLADPGARVVVCAPVVPCGAATERVERASGVTLRPVSEESSVTDVLNKVVSGEADAGVVYVTDVRSAGAAVRGVAFPESAAARNDYPIATLANSPDPELAQRFVDLVTGPSGRQQLARAGFGEP